MADRRSLAEHPVTRGTTHALKLTATALSAGAATISILSFAHSRGWMRQQQSAAAATSPAVVWLGVSPEADTAHAIGDTIQLTAALKDEHGGLIPGMSVAWSSDDPGVASVDEAGTVIARGEGAVNIVVAAGGRIARSRIAVRQRVSAVEILFDSTFRVPEGEHRPAAVRALDARGHRLPGSVAAWATNDTAVARVDSAGVVSGLAPGRTVLEARVEDVLARIELEVVPVPGAASVVSGAAQRADAGAPLPQPIVIQVLSRGGRPIAGVPVRFATEAGGGTTTAQSDLTDSQGKARASWSLGNVPGRQRLSVTVPGMDSALTLQAEADPVPGNTRVLLAAEPPSGPAGDSLLVPVAIRVSDTLGTGLGDLPVVWTAPDGGRVTGLAARTDSAGEARAAWRLGPKAGPQRIRVQVGNRRRLPVFSLRTTATPGVPDAASVVAGGGQVGRVGSALKGWLQVRVTDRNGNRVPAARIVLHPEAGSVAESTLVADSAGQAQFHWTLGRAAGIQRLMARVEGIQPGLLLTATARPLGPAKVAFTAPPAEVAAGRAQPRPMRVVVSDPYGNPLPAQEVWFTATDGKVTPLRATTDARGVATTQWTPGSKANSQSLTASLKGSRLRDTVAIRVMAPKRTASASAGSTVLH